MTYNDHTPVRGYYKTRRVRGGPFVPVAIQPTRVGGLACYLGGEIVKASRVWPWCAKEPITEDEYHYLMAVRMWAVEHNPDAPEATPSQPVDHMKTPPVF